ncbi:MAG: hypothetical protein HQK55_15580 [Deltaproteobacteria bacterium]|nr:hypothetical protein [Deltaproteobacteria bacterium]
MKSLKIALNNRTFEIELAPEFCPETLKQLESCLPFRTELHYAKIAGEEIMAVMPFHVPLESPMDVSRVKAGMLAFWPQRNLLCLYYGRMQEESASITFLGYLKDEVAQFAPVGEEVRRDQGKKLTYGTFYVDAPPSEAPVIKPTYPPLHPFEYEIWEKLPDEILELTKRSGIMRPVGPLLYAEADTHAFHEYLAVSKDILPSDINTLSIFSKVFGQHLKAFHNKMAGWYLLPQTAAVIESYLGRFSQLDQRTVFEGLLENLTLFVGRLNYWIDALIPWDDFNENMKRNPGIG